ncbi:hypothetical protein ES703_87296 [subsurface metagenome]
MCSFTHVQDIVNAMVLIMESNQNGEIYNVGNPANTVSIHALAQQVINLSGSKSRIDLVDPITIFGPHYAEAWNKIPDISKIQKELNWQGHYSLEEIIKEIIASYR